MHESIIKPLWSFVIMDVATIVLTASSVIIILQLISIVLIVKNKKSTVIPQAAPAPAPQPVQDQRDFRKKRDDNRFNRRPAQEQRPKPPVPAQPQAVDYVEKSLRDINLRLKNAERDQENARKKLKDDNQSPASVNQGNPRRPDNNQNRQARGRDDDFRRRDRGNSRPNNYRNNQNNPNQQTNRSFEQEKAPIEQAKPFEAVIETPVIPVIATPVFEVPIAQPVVQVQAPVVEKDPVVVQENAEVSHGRKVLVRRRILTPEEQAAKNAEESTQKQPQQTVGQVASSPENEIKAAEATQEMREASLPDNNGQPISFGR